MRLFLPGVLLCGAAGMVESFQSPLFTSTSKGTKSAPLHQIFSSAVDDDHHTIGSHAMPSSSPITSTFTSSSTSPLAAPFSQIIHSRYANSAYRPDPVPFPILTDILRLTQRAPSSFNIQPYVFVVARSIETRQRLAHAMLGRNGVKVKSAPVTVAFAADLESSRLMPKVVALMRKSKAFPEAFLEKVPFFATLFSSGYRLWPVRWVMWLIKRLTFSLLGLFQAVPRPERPETWASKNTMLAAMSFMLAATAHGLTTCPLEGFDESRVRKALGIPRRYAIPVLVTLGYEAEGGEGPEGGGRKVFTERFPLEEVAHDDGYGNPWPSSSSTA